MTNLFTLILELQFVETANGLYHGHLDNQQKQHGTGIFLWDSGELYYGTCSYLLPNNIAHQQSCLGSWQNGMLEGHGVLYFALGGYLCGSFSKNKVHGQAALHFPNKDFLVGRWENGLLNGKIVRYFAHNDAWVLCEYREGVLNGKIKAGKGQPPFGNDNSDNNS